MDRQGLTRPRPSLGIGRAGGSRVARRPRTVVLALAGLVAALAVYPAAAQAHGPIAPAASSYFAKVLAAPGRPARRRWSTATCGCGSRYRAARPWWSWTTGAPRTCGSRRTGVDVNHNSSMYYLNETPVAQTPPSNLSPIDATELASGDRRTRATSGTTAGCTRSPRWPCSPGVSFVGRWRIPVRVDGQLRLDLRRSVALGRSDDRVVLGDRGAGGVRAGGLASAPSTRSTGWSPACSRSRLWSR